MSIALMTAVWSLQLPATDKVVLLALADNANDAGCCWPAMGTIARKCGLTDRAVRAAMRRLEAAGHVSSVERSGTSRIYTVHPGTTFRPEGDSVRKEIPVTPERRSPKPSRTIISSQEASPPSKSAGARRSVGVDDPIGEPPPSVEAERWDSFVEMRRALARKPRGKPWTPGAVKEAIRKLVSLEHAGENLNAVLAESTLNGWAGLYPVKNASERRNPISSARRALGREHSGGRTGAAADAVFGFDNDEKTR